MLYKNIEIYTNGQTDRRRNLLGVPAFVKAFAKAMGLHSYLLLSLMKQNGNTRVQCNDNKI